jgi:hypothetical protein
MTNSRDDVSPELSPDPIVGLRHTWGTDAAQ